MQTVLDHQIQEVLDYTATAAWTTVMRAKELYTLLPPLDKEVVNCILQGMQHDEASRKLNKSYNAVKNRINRLGKRLGIHSLHVTFEIGKMFVDVLNLEQQSVPGHFHFTPREFSIVRLLVEGKTYPEIAKNVGLASQQEVKNYLRDVFDKTGCDNRLELMFWYEAHRKALHEPDHVPVMVTLPRGTV
jgi:DNA-binding NarL/FixJ family response regulator